jgi:DNA polymerase III subunit delta
MVALKAADIDRFVARPDPDKPIVLVFGPDAGLVRERTDALIHSAVDDPRDPFALARLEGDALADQPERLVEEAHTFPLFGGRRAVWVKAGGRNFSAAVERLLAAPPAADCRVVIEAGDVRRGAPLRTLCERAAIAVTMPCYADSGRDLDRLVDEEMRRAGISIAPDARTLLTSLIGGDRRASRSEIRKLILYAHGKSNIVADDVFAIVADATTPAVDAVVDAAFAGRAADVESSFAKAKSSGVSAPAIAGAAVRQAAALHRLRHLLDSGSPIDDALRRASPMIHFSREKAVKTALATWSATRLERMMVQLGDTALDARKYGTMSYPIVERALLSIARSVRQSD